MNESHKSLLKTLEALGPQIFAIEGDLCLWIQIIETVDKKAINALLRLIQLDAKTCDQRYALAVRILNVGFDATLEEYERQRQPLKPSPEPLADTPVPTTPVAVNGSHDTSHPDIRSADESTREVVESNASHPTVDTIDEDIYGTKERLIEMTSNVVEGVEDTEAHHTSRIPVTAPVGVDEGVVDMEEEVIPQFVAQELVSQELVSQELVSQELVFESDGIFEDVFSQPVSQDKEDREHMMSPDSYKSCLQSPQTQETVPTDDEERVDMDLSPVISSDHKISDSLEIVTESDANYANYSTPITSRPSLNTKRTAISIITGATPGLQLSPITGLKLSPHRVAQPSPTLSLNMSYASVSSASPKSWSSRCSVTSSGRSQSKRSPPKSPEELIEQYKCLVPYESYGSEQNYIKLLTTGAASDGETSTAATEPGAVLPDLLMERIVEQNIKYIHKFNE